MVLAKQYGIREHDLVDTHAEFVPFTAQTRMSGVDLNGQRLRKGAGDAVIAMVEAEGGQPPAALREELDRIAGEGGTPLAVARDSQGSVGSREESIASEAPQAVSERLLALVEPYPGAQRLVRRAWRSAQRLGAELDLLWVRPPGALSEEQERALTALRQLSSLLGARLIVEESDAVPETIAGVARRQRSTYILMGRSRPARGFARMRTPLPQRLLELLPGVDVRIVADRAQRPTEEQP